MRIEKVGVLEGGDGFRISESVARAGLEVTVRDVDAVAIDGASKRVEASLARALAGGKLDEAGTDEVRSRINFTFELEEIADADLVVEAVPENADLKVAILAQVAGLV